MTPIILIALYATGIVCFLCGAWWGRVSALRAAQDAAVRAAMATRAAAASLLEDEACRAALHADPETMGRMFRLAARVRGGDVEVGA